MTRFARRAIMALALLGIVAPAAAAQHPQVREGFWFSIGVGGGSLDCSDCDERTRGGAGILSFGGRLSNTVLLAGSANGWTRSEDGATLTVGLVALEARFYPAASGGFFLKAGAGIGSLDLDLGPFTLSETGAGALLGLGYDIRVGRMISITPWFQVYGIDYDPGDSQVAQLGVALTFH